MLSARELRMAADLHGAGSAAPAPSVLASHVATSATLVVIFLAGLTVSSHSVGIAMVALALLALTGPMGTIAAVTLAGFVRLLHPDLVTQGVESAALSWVVLLVAGIRTLPRVRREDAATLAWFWAFIGWAVVTSIFTSALPLVSVMKAAILAWTVTTLFVACRSLDPAQRAIITGAWIALGLVVVGLSLATLARSAVAYATGGTGLQGILWHPQTLAVMVAPVVAAAAAQSLLYERRVGILLLLLGSAIVLFLTEARTGVVAAVAGVCAAILMPVLQAAPAGGAPRRLKAWSALLVMALALLIAVVASSNLAMEARGFLLKHSGESSLGEAFRQSRGEGIAAQWASFRERPLLGHGFGVNPGHRANTEVVKVWDIPVSAPTEKGFILSAALEETGLVGFALLLVALGGLARRAWRSADARMLAVFSACLVTNFGEATLFAAGGVGLLLWSAIALVTTRPTPP